jgi:hypothetical protein
MPAARRDRLGVCVESFTGSLDTDIRFAQTPRPSIFAYTLPSTVIGEICIRFRLKGPVLSLISPDTRGANAMAEAAEWLRHDDAEMVLCLGIEAMNSFHGGIPFPCRKTFRRAAGTARRCCSVHSENSPRENEDLQRYGRLTHVLVVRLNPYTRVARINFDKVGNRPFRTLFWSLAVGSRTASNKDRREHGQNKCIFRSHCCERPPDQNRWQA